MSVISRSYAPSVMTTRTRALDELLGGNRCRSADNKAFPIRELVWP